jgi:hypothetical protein
MGRLLPFSVGTGSGGVLPPAKGRGSLLSRSAGEVDAPDGRIDFLIGGLEVTLGGRDAGVPQGVFHDQNVMAGRVIDGPRKSFAQTVRTQAAVVRDSGLAQHPLHQTLSGGARHRMRVVAPPPGARNKERQVGGEFEAARQDADVAGQGALQLRTERGPPGAAVAAFDAVRRHSDFGPQLTVVPDISEPEPEGLGDAIAGEPHRGEQGAIPARLTPQETQEAALFARGKRTTTWHDVELRSGPAPSGG